MKSEEYKRGYDAAMREVALSRRDCRDHPAPAVHERMSKERARRMRGDDPILRSAESFHAIGEQDIIR